MAGHINFSFPADALSPNSMVVLKYLFMIMRFTTSVETQLQETSFSSFHPTSLIRRKDLLIVILTRSLIYTLIY